MGQDPSGLQAPTRLPEEEFEDAEIADFANFIREREENLDREKEEFLNRGNRPITRSLYPNLGSPPGAQYVAPLVLKSYGALRGSEEIETVVVKLQTSALQVGTPTNNDARMFARLLGKPTDDAGHILGNKLGGSGTDFTNIFPQSPNINRGQYRDFEAEIVNHVLAGENVTVRIQRRYQTTISKRPYQVLVVSQFKLG